MQTFETSQTKTFNLILLTDFFQTFPTMAKNNKIQKRLHRVQIYINSVKDLVKKVRKVRNDGLGIFRRLCVNIYALGKYIKRTTKSRFSSNVRRLNIFQP